MSVPVSDDPGDGGGSGGGPAGTPTPPTQPGTVLAIQISSTTATITADQIAAAGGPWSSFSVRVTPLNGNGSGAAQTVNVTVAPPADPPPT